MSRHPMPDARPGVPASAWSGFRLSIDAVIATASVLAIAAHLLLRFGTGTTATVAGWPVHLLPLLAVLGSGGLLLVVDLARKLARFEFASDLLAGLSIVTGVVLGEYLAATLVVLMLSGGQALERYAVRRASLALDMLARRVPTHAHRRRDDTLEDVPLGTVVPGDVLVVFPHETCPVDGVVVDGRGTMDESYLTGEPWVLPKAAGAAVLSGAINGESALTVRAEKRAVDSRYASIMQVMRESEQRRPRLRRLGDLLGAWYTPLAVGLALVAWAASGDPVRFLAVLVVATPCPLLIGIPVAVIGAVSMAARRGIVIRDPTVLERLDTCRTAIFDKTGTLTYGEPTLTEIVALGDRAGDDVLGLTASLERYSRHPLADAVVRAAEARGLVLADVTEVSERPGEGLRGRVNGHTVHVTSRKALSRVSQAPVPLPEAAGGLECLVVVDGRPAALCRFRDEPRSEGRSFVTHLSPRHGFDRLLIVSGDRENEVRYLATQVGIKDVYAEQSPEQKVAIVRAETAQAPTVFMGDGINDAPALTAATVGIAFGQASDVTTEAAGAVVMDSSLQRVDELLHIGRRMRRIALQTAVGGMALSVVGMLAAAAGYLPPVLGALVQEGIDVVAVLNALRTVAPPRVLTDYGDTQ